MGYFVTHSTILAQTMKDKMIEGIRKAQTAVMEVKIVVLAQGTNNQALYLLLRVTTEKPYFEVDSKKVWPSLSHEECQKWNEKKRLHG